MDDLEVIDAMARDGGSFVKALAEAMRHADPENLAKLKDAFPEVWRKYGDVARVRQIEERSWRCWRGGRW